MVNFPDTYVPSSSRQPEPRPREEAFAVGQVDGPNSIGFTHGPFPKLEEALEQVPDDPSVIVHFRSDGYDKVLYVWCGDYWGRCTCGDCHLVKKCQFAFDSYNINGECLAQK